MKKPYLYTVVIGIDGMGAFNSLAETPEMDKIFENGATTFSALSLNPTISAENWGGMLIGASPVVHKLTNSIVGQNEYDNDALPSVFKRIREKMPDAFLASYCNWEPINHGIIEHNLGVELVTAEDDEKLTEKILPCVARKPKFFFIQFDDVDGAGHSYGYATASHLEQITRADALVGKIFNAYSQAGIIDDTLFIVIADHGGFRRGHGGYTDGEKYVFLGAAGREVKKGEISFAQTKDIAAIVLYSLGLELPTYDDEGFSSRLPSGVFDGVGGYLPKKGKTVEFEMRETPAYSAENGLSAFVPENSLKLAMFFDNSLEDATGQCGVTQHGLVKYYSQGVYGSRGEFGCTGHAVIDGISFGKESFSIAVWLKIDRSIFEATAVCGNKDWWWQCRNKKGFMLALRGNDTLFCIADGEQHEDFVTPYPEEVSDGFIHTTVCVDKEKRELRVYYNFKQANTVKLDERYLCSLDALAFTVGNDGEGAFNSETWRLLFNMDDLLVFNGALTSEQVERLGKYYYG